MGIPFDTRNAPVWHLHTGQNQKGYEMFFPFFHNPDKNCDFGPLENNQHISLNNELYFEFMSVAQTALSQ